MTYPSSSEVIRHIASKVRRHRIANGLTQLAFAERIGVTYQQIHKYEAGVNRIASDRLWKIAQVLEVEVSAFFDGIGEADGPRERDRPLLELTRNYVALKDERRRDAVRLVARLLCNGELQGEAA